MASQDVNIRPLKKQMSLFITDKILEEMRFFSDTIPPSEILVYTKDSTHSKEASGEFLVSLPYLKFYRKRETTLYEFYYIRERYSYYAFMSGDGKRWLPFSFPHFELGKVSFCDTPQKLAIDPKNPLLYLSEFSSRYMLSSSLLMWSLNDFIEITNTSYISELSTFKARYFLKEYEKKSQEDILDYVNYAYETIHDSYQDDVIYDFNDFEPEVNENDGRSVGTATAG